MEHDRERNDSTLSAPAQPSAPFYDFRILTKPPMQNNSERLDNDEMISELPRRRDSLSRMVDRDMAFLKARTRSDQT